MSSNQPKITNLAYFEEMALQLEKLVESAYPSLYLSEPAYDQEEGIVSIQADIPIPGREELFFIEWSQDTSELNEEYRYECSIFTADGEELATCFSREITVATIEAVESCQNLLASLECWLNMSFKS